MKEVGDLANDNDCKNTSGLKVIIGILALVVSILGVLEVRDRSFGFDINTSSNYVTREELAANARASVNLETFNIFQQGLEQRLGSIEDELTRNNSLILELIKQDGHSQQ